MTTYRERQIVYRVPVQPTLAVVIEDTLNIMIELTTPDGHLIARSDVISNMDRLKDALDMARVWVTAS